MLRARFLRRLCGGRAMGMAAMPAPTSLAALIASPSIESDDDSDEDPDRVMIEDDFELLERQGCAMTKRACLAIVKGSSNLKILRRVAAHLATTNRTGDAGLCRALIEGYGRCGSVDESLQVFNSLRRHNYEMWSTLIGAHIKCGRHAEAADLVRTMIHFGEFFRREVYVYAIEAATELREMAFGKMIHACAVESGNDSRPVVCSRLITMYATCNMLREARRVFDQRRVNSDPVVWSAIVSAFAQEGHYEGVLKLFWKMPVDVQPDLETCLDTIEACSEPDHLRKVHARISQLGISLGEGIQEALFFRFLDLASLEDASMVFEDMLEQHRCLFQHWDALARAYHQHKCFKRFVGFCRVMNLEGYCFQDDPTLLQLFEKSQEKI